MKKVKFSSFNFNLELILWKISSKLKLKEENFTFFIINLVFDIPYPAGVYVFVVFWCQIVKFLKKNVYVYRATVLGISNALCCC